jgi:competence ComEA-like helix-hairpin-helix protein
MNSELTEQGTHEERRRPLRAGLLIALLLVFIATMVLMWTERPAIRDDRSADAPALPDMRVDLNMAGVSELRLLPGIGPRLAERIVDERLAGGIFASIDDLSRVRGIGPATVERVRPFATVSETVIVSVGADE